MRAVEIAQYGGPEVLELVDVPEPTPEPDQLIVGIHAASINPADWKSREGLRREVVKATFPHRLGRDFSGVVTKVGEGVDGFREGDEVFAVLWRGTEGAYAEAVAIDAKLVALKPRTVTHIEAAALALTGLTALVALEETVALQAKEKILIVGGAGGVGSFAVQYARQVGAHVVATARSLNHDYLLALGADEVIDYQSTDVAGTVHDCDVVFDTVGNETYLGSFPCLKPGGRITMIASGAYGPEPPRDDVQVLRPDVVRDGKRMARIAELVDAGAIKPPEIQVMELADIVAAHNLIQTGHTRGKIVIEMLGTS